MRRVLTLARTLFAVAEAILIAVSLYQSAITILGRRAPARPVAEPDTFPRFTLIVCARNEAEVVGALLGDLCAQEYPRERFEVVLFAHNCTDATADVGRNSGVDVIEVQTAETGKAQALEAGLALLRPTCDLVGVFDADSRVPAGLLRCVAAASRDDRCLQVETVPHHTDDWLATGYGLGRKARNLFWWQPRERLGLGTTFSGSGYFLPPELLADLLRDLYTVTEDLEMTARLYARGERVAFVSSTFVQVEEPHSFGGSLRQRSRWVRGHLGVLRHYWWPLTRAGLRGDGRAADIAIYLAVPARVLTRTLITIAFILSQFTRPSAFILRIGLPLAMAGEWIAPATIAVRQRLVPLSLGGLEAAARHGLLSLLWFPIGIWALLTPRSRAWEPVARAAGKDSDATASGRG